MLVIAGAVAAFARLLVDGMAANAGKNGTAARLFRNNRRSIHLGLTRIRTNFWAFHEKYPSSGSNPAHVFPVATHDGTHIGHTGVLAAHFLTLALAHWRFARACPN